MPFISELKRILGKNLMTSKAEMSRFSRDQSGISGDMPLAVAIPSNTNQISEIMALCSRNKIHVTVRGGGSSLTGSSVPKGRSIVIDMSKFNKILETNIEDRCVVAQADVILDKLNKHLLKYKFFYPPLPASSSMATVGGSISTNAGGLRAVTYGVTKDWVLGLEFVLPNGKVIRSGGKVLKHSTGYDLTSLMIGSEGTLGVITAATLRIWPIPEATGMIVSYYPSIGDAARATGELKKTGITPISAEFLDGSSLDLIGRTSGLAIAKGVSCALMVTLASTKEALGLLLKRSEKILGRHAISVVVIKKTENAGRLFEARKEFFNTTLAAAREENKKLIIADAVVPSSSLPSALLGVRRAIKKSGLDAFLFGHMGDGNVHANILYQMGSESDKKKVDALQIEIARIAIRHGGSVSGEHGIGLLKKELLIEELKARGSSESLAVMKKIKEAIDPNYILNRSKIFD